MHLDSTTPRRDSASSRLHTLQHLHSKVCKVNKVNSVNTAPAPAPGFNAIIPADVRFHPNLPANAKLLYGDITALCHKEGFCWATNQYFAALYRVTARAVQRWIEALAAAGFVTVEIQDQYRRRLRLPEGERGTRVQKDAPPCQKGHGGMSQKTGGGVKKDTQSITENITKNKTQTPEGPPAASAEKTAPSRPPIPASSSPKAADPARRPWQALTAAEQAPYRAQAAAELYKYALIAGAARWARIGWRQEEVRARVMYECGQSGGETGCAVAVIPAKTAPVAVIPAKTAPVAGRAAPVSAGARCP